MFEPLSPLKVEEHFSLDFATGAPPTEEGFLSLTPSFQSAPISLYGLLRAPLLYSSSDLVF